MMVGFQFQYRNEMSYLAKSIDRRARGKGFVPGAAPPFDTNDSCVNTLIAANLNLLSGAIQGDTQRFEFIERFIKIRNLL